MRERKTKAPGGDENDPHPKGENPQAPQVKRTSLRDHEQKPGGQTRPRRGDKDKEGEMGGGYLSLTGKAHGRAVTRQRKGAVPERGKSRSQTNATQQMTHKSSKTPDRAW